MPSASAQSGTEDRSVLKNHAEEPRTLRFALAGRLVSSSKQARQILTQAMREGRTWLVPQARNVAIKLSRAGQ